MYSVNIRANLGGSLENIDTNVLQRIQSFNLNDSGDLLISCQSEVDRDIVSRAMLQSVRLDHATAHISISGTISLISLGDAVLGAVGVEAPTEPDQPEMQPPIEVAPQEAMAAPQETMAAPQEDMARPQNEGGAAGPRLDRERPQWNEGNARVVVDAGNMEVGEIIEGTRVDDNDRPPAATDAIPEEPDDGDIDIEEGNGDTEAVFRNVRNEGSTDQSLNAPLNTVNIYDAPEVIASGVSSLSSHAKILIEEVEKHNKLMSRLVESGRKIDKLRQPIIDSHEIQTIIEQSAQLIEADNKIDDILFTDQLMIVQTKELITSEKIDGAKRLIGKIEFRIKLASFFGETNDSMSISIRNLDREYVRGTSGRAIFHCGHVSTTGSACWGTAWEPIYSSLVKTDLHLLIDTLVRFVTTPNIEDAWGRHMKRWPVAEVGVNEA